MGKEFSMIKPTDQQDTYRLVFLESGGYRFLERVDVVAEFSIQEEGFRWRYLHHETRTRPTLASEWEEAKIFRMVDLNQRPFPFLLSQIRTRLEHEIWHHFFEPDPSSAPDPGRRQFLQLVFAYRVARMHHPRTSVQSAIHIIRSASGLSQPDFAKVCRVDRASVALAEKGNRGLSPTNLEKLADAGDRFMEWHAAEYLREQAQLARLHISERGGRR